jgi:ribosome-associated translation inhibitor RaiA
MIKVVFKNIDKSELAKDIVRSRLGETVDKFPELQAHHKLAVTLSMENSPLQAGPDLFAVKLVITGKKFDGIVIEKNAANLYLAVAELCEALLERLNRATDRSRVKNRAQARKVQFRHDAEMPKEA